ncbi:hypothetical protein BDZ97DRAFT_1826411 [Flammula alnicola]|nr:hypothetical protein BDZ97DRAFT_1826411 [Flammula alnicola]
MSHETLELKLIVRYHGIKATQYFSKYTDESNNVFRNDLQVLKLPHPKRDNTTFISHGCIECVWPAVAKEGVLHKHLKNKTQPPPELQAAFKETLSELSITNISLKQIYPQPHNRKRPRSTQEQPSYQKTKPGQDGVALTQRRPDFEQDSSQPLGRWVQTPTAVQYLHYKDHPHDEYPVLHDFLRPRKRARTEQEDSISSAPASTPPSNSSNGIMGASQGLKNKYPPFSEIRAAAPLSVIPPVKNQWQPVASGSTTTPVWSQAWSRSEPTVPKPKGSLREARAHADPPRNPNYNRQAGSTATPVRSQEPIVPTPKGPLLGPRAGADAAQMPRSVRQAELEYDIRKQKLKAENDRLANSHPNVVQPSGVVTSQTKGDLLVNDFLRNLNLVSTTSTPTAQTTNPLPPKPGPVITKTTPIPQHLQRRSTNEANVPVHPSPLSTSSSSSVAPRNSVTITNSIKPSSTLPTPPPSAPFIPPPSFRSGASRFFSTLPEATSSNSAYRPPSHLNEHTPVSVPPTPSTLTPPSPRLPEIAPTEIQAKIERRTPPRQPIVIIPTSTPVPATTNTPTRPAHEHIQFDSMPPNPDFVPPVSSRSHSSWITPSASVQRLSRESYDVKREIAASIAREAGIISELKALNSPWIPKQTRLEGENSAAMDAIQARLAQVEMELETEKRLRKEAEDAIMDIRRECKAPFIVPSLLDAFVELSRLTTMATRAKLKLPSELVDVGSDTTPADVVALPAPPLAPAAVSAIRRETAVLVKTEEI